MLLTSSLGKRGTCVPLSQVQCGSCLGGRERKQRKSEESASAWLLLMEQNLNSYLSPDFLVESGSLKDVCMYTPQD